MSTWPSGQEPFVWAEGISAWPSTVLRLAACVAAIWFIYFTYWSLARPMERLSEEFRLPSPPWGAANKGGEESRGSESTPPKPVESIWSTIRILAGKKDGTKREWRNALDNIRSWFQDRCVIGWWPNKQYYDEDRRTLDGRILWEELAQRHRFRHGLYRSLLVLGLVALPLICIFIIGGWPTIPARGTASYYIVSVVYGLSLVLAVLLSLYVWDTTRLCQRFVQIVALGPIDWKTNSPSPQDWRLLPECENIRKDMHIVVELASSVGRAIWYPFIVLLIVIIANHSIFDLWPVQFASIVAFGGTAIFAFAAAITLRRAAEHARQSRLAKLRKHVARLHVASPTPVSAAGEAGNQAVRNGNAIVEVKPNGDRPPEEELITSQEMRRVHEVQMLDVEGHVVVAATQVEVDRGDERPRTWTMHLKPQAELTAADRQHRIEQINLLIHEIENERRGAFSPLTQTPALQALFLPFGGYGLIQLLEILAVT